MDWKSLLGTAIGLIPGVVMDVENTLHGANGQTKKEKALALVMEGVKIAAAESPAHADQIVGVASHVGNIIDSVVNIFHLTGLFQKKQAASATPGT